MRLTPRGVRIAVAAVVLYAAGELLGYPVLRVLGGACAGAVAIALVLVGRPPRVHLERTLYPDRVERGRPALARLVVRSASGQRQPAFVARDGVGDLPVEIAVRPLTPGTTATYHYELPTEQRGRHEVGPLTLTRRDLLGLASRHVSVGQTAPLWVWPRRHLGYPATGVHPRHHHEGPRIGPPLNGSMDLRWLREYVVGDEPRHLHWKASARTGKLMVREFLDPAQPRFTLVLDTRPDALDEPRFEAAVEIAASLLYASIEAGHRVRLCSTDGIDERPAGGRDLLDRLCLIAQRPGGADLSATQRTLVRGASGGALAIVGGRDAALARLPGLSAAYSEITVFAPNAAGVLGLSLITEVEPDRAVRVWNGTRRP